MINPLHEFVEKGWGHEEIIVNKEAYCGKILRFKKDKKCSFHYHKIKDETFFCARGRIGLWYGETDDFEKSEYIVLKAGASFYVPPGLRHQMMGLEEKNVLIEFSTQDFKEDSYRVIKGD